MIYSDIIDKLVVAIVALNTGLTVTIGALPANDSVSVAIGSGSTEGRYDKGHKGTLSVVCNVKHTNQKTALDTLDTIHKALVGTVHPTTSDYQVVSITTDGIPSYLGRQDDGYYLYGSSLRVVYETL